MFCNFGKYDPVFLMFDFDRFCQVFKPFPMIASQKANVSVSFKYLLAIEQIVEHDYLVILRMGNFAKIFSEQQADVPSFLYKN